MIEISGYIADGASAFLVQEYIFLAVYMVVFGGMEHYFCHVTQLSLSYHWP